MPYPITIGATKEGAPVFGAKECKSQGAVTTERVFGSQLAHRVVVRLDGSMLICTPTEAMKNGWEIVATFRR